MQQNNGWDHALKVTAARTGLVGHADAILLRKAADQAGLTAALSGALRKKGTSPLPDRGIVLASLAAAIVLGATSMSDIALLAHLAPVLGDAPSGPTVRRALDLAGAPAMLDRIARARAKAREHAWKLIEATPAGFPWLAHRGQDPDRVAGHRHGRHPRHRQLRQGRGRPDLEERLRLPPAGRLGPPCQHLHDQHEPSQLHGRRITPARSEPARTRAHRARPHPHTKGQTDMRPKNGYHHNQQADLKPRARGRQLAAMEPDAEFVDIVLETGGRALDELATELLASLGWID
jgi:hypothetical protein